MITRPHLLGPAGVAALSPQGPRIAVQGHGATCQEVQIPRVSMQSSQGPDAIVGEVQGLEDMDQGGEQRQVRRYSVLPELVVDHGIPHDVDLVHEDAQSLSSSRTNCLECWSPGC